MKTKLAASLFATTLAACAAAPSPTVVHAHASAVFTGSSMQDFGTLLSLNGTYGDGCTARSGAWTLLVQPNATPDHPLLSVVENDTGCVLTLTDMRSDAGDFIATPAVDLTASYQSTASSFSLASSPIAFYGNAMINPADFSTDFEIDILSSAGPSDGGDAGVSAGYTVTHGSVSNSEVPAPDYTIDVTGLSLQTDAADIVQSASGSAALTAGTTAGQTYVVVMGALSESPSFAEVDAAFQAAGPASAVGSSIGAGELALEGVDLSQPVARTIIVANTASGVTSYETLAITFTHP